MKLLICTPCFSGLVHSPYVISLINTIRALEGVTIDTYFLPSESLISRGRNKCARYALTQGYDKILFIDADLAWEPEDVALLLRSDKKIIGGTYPFKCFPIMINFNPLPHQIDVFGQAKEQDNYFEFIKKHAPPSGEVEVMHVPTGFMLIDLSVLIHLADGGHVQKYETFQPHSNETHIFFDFFPVRVHEGQYESEDWAFCSIARAAGFKVYLQTKIVCSHIGTHVYALGQHAAIGQKPVLPEGGNTIS